MSTVVRAVARAAIGSGLVLFSLHSPALAQDLSEKSIQRIMEYAWAFTPDRFTRPNGETIEIDRKNKDSILVPLDTAREVVKAGRLSAHAQNCRLLEEQVLNHRSLMRREELKDKWSPQQIVYINQLHLITVMLLTGKVKLVEKGEAQPEVSAEQGTEPSGATCTPEQAAKVKELVTSYIKSGPPVSFSKPEPAKEQATK